MSAATAKPVEVKPVEVKPAEIKPVETPDVPHPSCRKSAARALTIVRDGVITGEGPTTRGRIHFSRALDADDAAWCARILTASAVEHQSVSRAEIEALFEINDAAAERSDDGRFDDLLAKAVAHHAAAESGLPVARAAHIDAQVLEWIAGQMRGKRRGNHRLATLVAMLLGVAALPLAQLPGVLDMGMM
jgi:hypothetical protein